MSDGSIPNVLYVGDVGVVSKFSAPPYGSYIENISDKSKLVADGLLYQISKIKNNNPVKIDPIPNIAIVGDSIVVPWPMLEYPGIYKFILQYELDGIRSTSHIYYVNVLKKFDLDISNQINSDIETVNTIKTVIDNRLTGRGDISSYLIGGRQVTTISTDELVRLLRKFEERIITHIRPRRPYYKVRY